VNPNPNPNPNQVKQENIVHFIQPVPIMILQTVLYLKKAAELTKKKSAAKTA